MSPFTRSLGSRAWTISFLTNSAISFLRHLRRVLRADDDRVDPHRPVAVVLDVTWLLLSGRSQSTSPSAGLGQPVEDAVRERDRQRHQLRRVVAGVAEHQPLVAGAVAIDPHRDVGALAVQRHHLAGLGAEAHLVSV
jgi:hypothetical protein